MRKAAKKQRLTQQQKRQLKKSNYSQMPSEFSRWGVWHKFYNPIWQTMQCLWYQTQADESLLANPNHLQSPTRKIESIKYQWQKAQIQKNKNLKHCDISTSAYLQYLRDLYQIEKDYKSLSNKGFDIFIKKANTLLFAEYGASETIYRYARQLLQQFVAYQNTNFRLNEHYFGVVLAPQAMPSKINPLQITESYVRHGKQFNKILDVVKNHWQTTKKFKIEEKIGWLIFSGIAFGGINDAKMLHAWLINLLNNDFQPYLNYRLLTQIRYANKNYGNERLDDGGIYNSQQICIDPMSQCWLLALQHDPIDASMLGNLNIHVLLFNVITPLLKQANLTIPSFSRLLQSASSHWERLRDVHIDHALTMVLQGRQVTTGLRIESFLTIHDSNFTNHDKVYDIDELLTLTITANNHKNIDNLTLSQKAEQRKTDVLINIRKVLREPNARLYHITIPNFDSLSKRDKVRYKLVDMQEVVATQAEKVLLAWVIDLVKERSKTSLQSIEKYLFTIGYEWLYFVGDSELQGWEADDFEELYEEIVDFKKSKLKNKDIAYSAKLLKRLHNFGMEKFGFVEADIPEATAMRCVRAEWISPNLYQRILLQIRRSIDPMEADMFLLLFILAYRTGMRKKELLGLRFSDIEAIGTDEPSLLIRPNNYRKTKTEGSIRRVALYALLSLQELEFFTEYVKSNHISKQQQYLFTLSTENTPIPSHTPLKLLDKIVKDISPNADIQNTSTQNADTKFTFHAFRHTAISNLALALNADDALTQTLTGLNTKHIDQIVQGLLGVQKYHTDKWYAISGLMGHLSPERSFEYYNHFAMLTATYELSKANIGLPYDSWINITNLQHRAISKRHDVQLADIRALLFRENFGQKLRKSTSFAIANLNFNDEIFGRNLPKHSDSPLLNYRPQQIQAVLEHLEKNPKADSNVIGDDTLVSPQDIGLIKQKAFAIQKLMTERRHYRFLHENTHYGMIAIQTHFEHRMLGMMLRNANILRQDLPNWQFFIRTLADRMTTTDSSIPFGKSYGEVQILLKFLPIAITILPKNRWMISCDEPILTILQRHQIFDRHELFNDNDNQFEDINAQPEAQLSTEKLEEVQTTLKFRYKNDNSQTSILIGIATLDNQLNRTNSWRFSALLRYFTHFMLITDETLKAILPSTDDM